MSDSVQPHRQQPARLPRPWDSPGKNTGVGFSNAGKRKVKVKLLSRVRLFVTPRTAAHQAPPSMGFSRQGYWSGSPVSSPKLMSSPHQTCGMIRGLTGEQGRQPTLVFLPGESHRRRSLVGYTVHGVAKSRTRLSDFTFFLFLSFLAYCLSCLKIYLFILNGGQSLHNAVVALATHQHGSATGAHAAHPQS